MKTNIVYYAVLDDSYSTIEKYNKESAPYDAYDSVIGPFDSFTEAKQELLNWAREKRDSYRQLVQEVGALRAGDCCDYSAKGEK